MFDYKRVMGEYHDKLKGYYTEEAEFRRLQEKYERLQEKYKLKEAKLRYPHWMENVLRPLGEELVLNFPDSNFSVSGPFGMNCETSISLTGKNKECLAFLQFVPEFKFNDEPTLKLRDYSVDTRLFSRGTIGEMNGMNHPDIPIPADVTIQWFLDKIKYFHRTVEKWDSSKVS